MTNLTAESVKKPTYSEISELSNKEKVKAIKEIQTAKQKELQRLFDLYLKPINKVIEINGEKRKLFSIQEPVPLELGISKLVKGKWLGLGVELNEAEVHREIKRLFTRYTSRSAYTRAIVAFKTRFHYDGTQSEIAEHHIKHAEAMVKKAQRVNEAFGKILKEYKAEKNAQKQAKLQAKQAQKSQ